MTGGDAIGRTGAIASVGQRTVGRALDLMTIGLLALTVTIPTAERSGDSFVIPTWAQLVAALIWVAYETGTVVALGTTMGKMAAGTLVVDAKTGRRPSVAQAFIRSAVVPALVPLFSLAALLVYPLALLDLNHRRGVVDRLAGTVVVRATPRED